MELTLVHLYPDLMNIYGDWGNVNSLAFRCQKRGIKLKIRPVSVGDKLAPGSFDLVFGGGGQDKQQVIVSQDLQTKKDALLKATVAGIPMLTICGTYQLFGRYFKPLLGPTLTGIGIFNAYTVASRQRKIGNIMITSNLALRTSNALVGFENHSGNTYLADTSQALGKVICGFGNNGSDKTEGCHVQNVFGCYLHGSLLPKNPHFADYLIATALEVKYRRKIKLRPLDDRLEWQAHQIAVKITSRL